MKRNGITYTDLRACFLSRNDSEQNSESLLLFFFHGMEFLRNGIPRVFCSSEQPEFRRNKPFASFIPSSAEFFYSKFPTLGLGQYSLLMFRDSYKSKKYVDTVKRCINACFSMKLLPIFAITLLKQQKQNDLQQTVVKSPMQCCKTKSLLLSGIFNLLKEKNKFLPFSWRETLEMNNKNSW